MFNAEAVITRGTRIIGRCLAAIILLTVAGHSLGRAQDSKCNNSTVADAWGPKFADQARSFLTELQKAVEGNDAVKVARLVQYPVRIIGDGRQSKITRPSDFIQKYSSIITAKVRKAILAQSAECLFGNQQGVMVGNGEVWFTQDSRGQMRIITINTGAP